MDEIQRRRIDHFSGRILILGLVVAVLFAVLTVGAANLQLANAKTYKEQSNQNLVRTITIKGARGRVLDRNGLPMAMDVDSYDVTFYRDPSKKKPENYANYTDILQKSIAIIEKNGRTTIDTFAINSDKNGQMIFWFGPISDDVFAKRKDNWMQNMFIPKNRRQDPPAEIMKYLCQRYQIAEKMPYDEKRKLLSIWQEVTQMSSSAFLPVKIATNVKYETVAQLAAQKAELVGIDIENSTQRFYPRGVSAAHIVGYIGRMTSETLLPKYTDPLGVFGYAPDDPIGIYGIENSMEEDLSGNLVARKGSMKVEVNSQSSITKVLQTKPETNGNNVVLTIDERLQLVTEAALAENIAATRKYQNAKYEKNRGKYDPIVADRGFPIRYAKMGACVVMDVRTGEVLAMANYPSFDPNLFVGGISEQDYAKLRDDPALPLFNKAIASKAHPGSIFKMVTAVAGLMEKKLTLAEHIDDQGPYTKHLAPGVPDTEGPNCWIKSMFRLHNNQDLIVALKNSCNYYFYEVAYRLHIDLLYKWANRLGLDTKTNIELPGELQGQVANPKVLYDLSIPAKDQTSNTARLVYRALAKMIQDVYKGMGVVPNQKAIDEGVGLMMADAVKTQGKQGSVVRHVLTEDLGIPNAVIAAKGLESKINSYLNEILWNANHTLVAGIGQDLTLVTPIAVARYVSALVNGGMVYDAHIVKQVLSPQGEIIKEAHPTVVRELGIPLQYLDAIKEGMREVVSGEDGTATNAFAGFKYLHDMGGKTGTAQVSDIDIEQNAWFVSFAPYESPEIAVVVFIPQGSSGANSTLAARRIIEYWLDQKTKTPTEDMPTVGGMARE